MSSLRLEDFLTINDQLAIMKLMKAKACCCPGVAVERTGMWTPCQKESLHLLIEWWNVAANFERGRVPSPNLRVWDPGCTPN
jgi:hypothetical protein